MLAYTPFYDLDMIFSNIPYSEKPYHINGKKVHNFRIFTVPLLGFKFGILILTYNGKLVINVSSNDTCDFNFDILHEWIDKNIQSEIDKLKHS